MSTCNITSEELSDALDITLEKLVEVCDFFDANLNDDWELIENIHFIWQTYSSRTFSSEGAIEICNYLEENWKERPLLNNLKRWLLRRNEKLKGLMIAKKVHEVSELPGELIFKGDTAFLGPRACREILRLGKRQDVLDKTFKKMILSENTEIESLKINTDFFEDQEDKRYYSRSGIASVGKHLNTSLTQKHRKEWAQAVEEYAPKALKAIEDHEAAREKRINRAMDQVRRQAKKRCQITNRKQNIAKIDIEIHHLFDRKTYPDLADREENLIAIGADIHRNFHMWMGGSNVSCTVEDMESYIEEFGNILFPNGDAEQLAIVSIRLSRAKKLKNHF